MGIEHGERIAVLAAAQSEFSFEVGSPDIVWSFGYGERLIEWCPPRRATTGSSPELDESMPLEQGADGASGWPWFARLGTLEKGEQLAWAPGGVRMSEIEYLLGKIHGELVSSHVRSVGPIKESGISIGREADEPFVAGLLADIEAATNLNDGAPSALYLTNKFHTE